MTFHKHTGSLLAKKKKKKEMNKGGGKKFEKNNGAEGKKKAKILTIFLPLQTLYLLIYIITPRKSGKKKQQKNAVGIINKVSRILAANCGWDATAATVIQANGPQHVPLAHAALNVQPSCALVINEITATRFTPRGCHQRPESPTQGNTRFRARVEAARGLSRPRPPAATLPTWSV